MRTAIIHGFATATVKHPSFAGQALLIAVPESPDTAPQIVIDPIGSGLGQRVLITSDGSEARLLLHDPSSPARWAVCGILDANGPENAIAAPGNTAASKTPVQAAAQPATQPAAPSATQTGGRA